MLLCIFLDNICIDTRDSVSHHAIELALNVEGDVLKTLFAMREIQLFLEYFAQRARDLTNHKHSSDADTVSQLHCHHANGGKE